MKTYYGSPNIKMIYLKLNSSVKQESWNKDSVTLNDIVTEKGNWTARIFISKTPTIWFTLVL